MGKKSKLPLGIPRASGVPSQKVLEMLRKRVVANGGLASDIPDMPFRMLRPAEIAQIAGISMATVYRMMDSGELPRPISLGRDMSRVA